MAKIKSTLDLVMERTKDLSMTEEEKERLRRKEWTEKIRGWVQKLIDDKFTIAELSTSFKSEADAYPGLKDILKDELVGHIDPEKENDLIFHALEEVLGLDTTPLKELIREYHNRLDLMGHEHLERLRLELRNKGIFGNAITPNLEHNEAWIALLKKLREEFRYRLNAPKGI